MIQYKNKGRCKLCNTVIESKHRYDFVTCECGSFSLDGGLAYQRVLWRDGEFNDVAELFEEPLSVTEVQASAAVSALEREREQEYYVRLCELLLNKGDTISGVGDGKNNEFRTQDGVRKRKVPVRTSTEHGEEVGEKA